MDKPFKVADIHAWIKQVTEGQISYSRMVELMNEQSEAYAAKLEQKLAGEPCFTDEDSLNLRVMDLPSEQLNYLNSQASQYAADRAKKVLEKVLLMLRENQAASSQLVTEDAARSAQDIINETFVDLIEIVQTFKP